MGKNNARPKKPIERLIESLLEKMSLPEKVSLLSGRDVWHTNSIKHLGVHSVVMTDGPHGVRACHPEMGRIVGPTTCFPTGVAMGASWDPELVEKVGKALGEETRAMGCDILLGPCVNIVRGPLGGRNFETYAEDPYLAGRLGVAFVNGVQSQGVGTSVKHFACNNQEIERFRSSSNLDERTLREIYLPAFEAIVKEARPWTVMCSYNRINGIYASQHHTLLKEILKGEWGFDGVVVSDWDANHTVFESIKNGLDLEMPGPAKYYGRLLEQAVMNWQLPETVLDEAVRRVLRLVIRTGKQGAQGRRNIGSVNTPEHQVLARQVAEESAVLLKNEHHFLPLDIYKIKSLAVIGPNAGEARIGGGGSSYVVPPYRISPLQALRERLDGRVTINYAKGCDNEVSIPIIPGDWLEMPNRDGIGLFGEYFNNSDMKGVPAYSGQDTRLDFWWFAATAGVGAAQRSSGRWTGTLRIPETGSYQIRLTNSGLARVFMDGEVVLENCAPIASSPELGIDSKDLVLSLNADQAYAIRIEFSRHENQDFAHWRLAMHQWQDPATDNRLDLAVEAAAQCDIAVVFAGMPEFFESEGWDRPDMELPGRQNELISRVLNANPNTIVVLNAGAPVNMPWRDQVPVILAAFYPGMEGGNAIARILLGEVNPSGKLPVTYPKRLEDTPAYINTTYPGARDINYGEGIFVGYRYYDKRKLKPAFPFGHGLSYTNFNIGAIDLPNEVSQGDPFEVKVKIINTGLVAGKEVVQLYINDLAASLPRPPKELKGFKKVWLQPGDEQVVCFNLVPRDLSFYDPYRKVWVAEPGEFEVLVGVSSEDIHCMGKFTLI